MATDTEGKKGQTHKGKRVLPDESNVTKESLAKQVAASESDDVKKRRRRLEILYFDADGKALPKYDPATVFMHMTDGKDTSKLDLKKVSDKVFVPCRAGFFGIETAWRNSGNSKANAGGGWFDAAEKRKDVFEDGDWTSSTKADAGPRRTDLLCAIARFKGEDENDPTVIERIRNNINSKADPKAERDRIRKHKKVAIHLANIRHERAMKAAESAEAGDDESLLADL